MKIKYLNSKVEKQCTSMKEARKLFGGNELLARSLHARINSLESAECIKDIIVLPTLHFISYKVRMKDFLQLM